jgi:sterol 24-C-methyltransferase
MSTAEELLNKGVKYAESNPLTVAAAAVASVGGALFLWRKRELSRDGKDFDAVTAGFKILNNTDHTLKKSEFHSSISNYEGQFKGARQNVGAITSEESVEERRQRYADMINDFYNLVTDFYEWGWGQSFHFGPRFHNETFVESIKRTEYHLCSRLGMKPGVRALDVGCGVGGPMRNMAIFSGATIDGITINEYQVKIGNKYNEKHQPQNQQGWQEQAGAARDVEAAATIAQAAQATTNEAGLARATRAAKQVHQ